MKKKRYESRLFFVMLFTILVLGLLASYSDPTAVSAGIENKPLSGIDLVVFWVGVVMIVLGVIIRSVAIATLRKNFSNRLRIRKCHTLVKNGIYQWVRHPAYLGLILIFLGAPLLFSSVLGFLIMLLIVPLLIHRIRLEEGMLIERFGTEYEEYMTHSKKLIPFLY